MTRRPPAKHKWIIRKSPWFQGRWVVYAPEHSIRVSYVSDTFEDARTAYIELSATDYRFCRHRPK